MIKDNRQIATIGINKLYASLHCITIVGFLFYGCYGYNYTIKELLIDKNGLFFVLLLYLSNHVSQTIFVLYEDQIKVSKPFIPILFDKTYTISSIEKISFYNTRGKTLVPTIEFTLKNGRRVTFSCTANNKVIHSFLDKIQQKGVEIINQTIY